jgi:hypothetical protein
MPYLIKLSNLTERDHLKDIEIDVSGIFHHHHMTLQPKSGSGLPFWCFLTITFLQGWIVSPAPNPQPGGPDLRIYDPRGQGGPDIFPGTGYPLYIYIYIISASQ